ncbi:MAG: glycosyl hydrolase, partial [Bacteroidota bacterium]|nr:glycosyl hydrolase [Bacteroidota bacterium]
VTRADQKRAGVLYAGTEFGMYVSFDDGANWKPFQLNLPVVPVTDLTIKENDLVVATQGRSFYVLDDLSVLQQNNNSIASKDLHVYQVNEAYRLKPNRFASFFGEPRNAGTNPPAGAVINYYAKNVDDSTAASVTILDKNRQLIRTYSTTAKEANAKMEINKGMNQFVWNLLYPESERVEGMILWNGVPAGIVAPPGNYFARVKVGKDSSEVPFTIKADPNYTIAQAEYDQQFQFLHSVQNKFDETQKTIKDIRSLRTQINSFITLQGKDVPADVKTLADSIHKKLNNIEETLYQTKAKSSQDVLNYPIKLNDKLSGLFDVANSGQMAPSKQVQDVYKDLLTHIDIELAKFKVVKEKDVPSFNELVRQKSLPVIGLK